jgi:putative heme-binding domain-containing protein
LVKLLESDVDQHRYLARNALRSSKQRKATQGDSRQPDPTQTNLVLNTLDQWIAQVQQRRVAQEITLAACERWHLEALWVQQQLGAVQPKLLERVLTSPEPRARAAGVRALCYLRDEVPSTTEKLVRAAEDAHPRVRLEAVRAASFLEPNDGETVLQAAVKFPLDYYLQYTMNETAATLELRGGRPGGAAMVAVERLAGGGVASDQVLPLVQLSITEADARSMSRLLLAVAENPSYSAETKIQVVDLLRQEAATRKISPPLSPEKLLALTEGALQERQPTLAASILSLAEAWQIPGMVVELQKYAIGPEVPTPVAQVAFSALAADPSPSAGDAVREITSLTTDQRTLLHASAALADRNLRRSLEALLKALRGNDVDFALLRPAVDAVLRQQGGARGLIEAIANDRLKPDAAKLLLRASYAVGSSDAKLASALTTAAGINTQSKPLTTAEKAKLVQRIEREGDPHAGELIYRRTELSCQKCHGISGAGGNVGPDLNAVGANSPLDYLVDSILLPSQQIKEAFITRRVLTSTGQVVTGIRVDGNEKRVILRDAEGKEITIATEDIESESDGPSLMPEGLHNLLTERELVDLIKFLSVLGKPGEYGLSHRPLARSYHVLMDAAIQESLAKAEEGKMEQMLSGIPSAAWQPRFGMTDGRWLKEEAVANNRLPLVLRTEVKLSVPGELAVRVSPVEDVQVVIGGQSVTARGEERISVNPGVHSVYLIYEKPPKWNALTVEVESR